MDPKNQEEVVLLRSDKTDYKPKSVRRDKEDHFILMKGTINQEGITIVNIYAPNGGAPNFIKQALLDL
jgi:hypothetical protein